MNKIFFFKMLLIASWLYLGCSLDGSSSTTDSSSAIQEDKGAWRELSPSAPWLARGDHTSVVWDDKIWLLGGIGKDIERKNDVWSSVDGKTWKELTSQAPWTERYDHTSVALNGKIWLLGGNDAKSLRNDVWSY